MQCVGHSTMLMVCITKRAMRADPEQPGICSSAKPLECTGGTLQSEAYLADVQACKGAHQFDDLG